MICLQDVVPAVLKLLGRMTVDLASMLGTLFSSTVDDRYFALQQL